MLINRTGKKAVIQYPCRWLFKVVTLDHHGDRERIVAMMQDCNFEISISNSSRSGKYTSLNVEVEVESEEHRNSIYQLIRQLETVKMIL